MLIFLLSFLIALITYYFFIRRLPPYFDVEQGPPDDKPDPDTPPPDQAPPDQAPGTLRNLLTIDGPVRLIIIALLFVAALWLISYLMFSYLYEPTVYPFGPLDYLHSPFAAQVFFGVSAGFTVGRIIDLSYFAGRAGDEKARDLIERRRRFYASGLAALVLAALLTASGNTVSDLLARVRVFKTPFAELQVADSEAGGTASRSAATVVSAKATIDDNVRIALTKLAQFHQILDTDRHYASDLVAEGKQASLTDFVAPTVNAVTYRNTVAPIMRCLYFIYLVDRDRAFIAKLLRPVVPRLRAVSHRAGTGKLPETTGVSDDVALILTELEEIALARSGARGVPLTPGRSFSLEEFCPPDLFKRTRNKAFGPAGPTISDEPDRISAILRDLPSDKRPYLTLFLAYVLMATDSEVAAVAEIDRWRRDHGPRSKDADNSIRYWHRFRLNRDMIALLSAMGANNEIPDVTPLLADLAKETLSDIERLAGARDWDDFYSKNKVCRQVSLKVDESGDLSDYLTTFHINYSNTYAYYGSRTFQDTILHAQDVLRAAVRIHDYSIDCASPRDINYAILENLETAASTFVAYARDLPGAEYRRYRISDLLKLASDGYAHCLLALDNRRQQRLDDIHDDTLFIGTRIDSSGPHLYHRCRDGAHELRRIARLHGIDLGDEVGLR